MAYRKPLLFALLFWLFFTSAVVAQSPWSFLVICDSRSTGTDDNNGVNTPILAEIANEIVAHNVDFVLFPGDLVNGAVDQTVMQSQFTTWRDTMQIVYDANIGVYSVRGNHDMGNPSATTAWKNVFTGDYALPNNGPTGEIGLTYSLSHKNAFIVGLDEYITGQYHRVNQTWLNAQLAANTKPHIFVFGHAPAFKADHSGCLDDYPTQRNAFWASLKNAGCRTYFCGHDHFYDHAVVDDGDGDSSNNIHQYIIGTAGAPLRPWSPPYNGENSGMTVEQIHHAEQFGYILVKVDDMDVTMIWYQRDDATGQYAPVIGSLDLEPDGVIDLADVAILAENWLRTDCRTGNNFCNWADIDQLTTVDMVDYALLSSECCE